MRAGAPRPRGNLRYTKPPLSLDELAGRLAERGLEIPDPERAKRYLRHVGYYRLSPYAIPFQGGRPDHVFARGTTFDDLLGLYAFDRALRLLVLDALERVEVAVRAALTDHMSTTYGDPHWYMEASHFDDRRKHANLLRIIRKTSGARLAGQPEPADGSLVHRSALEHYLTTYGSPELPPSWLMVETLTLGQLTNVIGNLSRRADRSVVAASMGLTERVQESWLRTYVRVRNVCAHHGRLWNLGLGVYPVIPTSSSISWLAPGALPDRSKKRLYPVLVSLQSVLDTVSPCSSWARRLHDLVSDRPRTNRRGWVSPRTGRTTGSGGGTSAEARAAEGSRTATCST
jgi:abortive infection bacteriophage resistance protein